MTYREKLARETYERVGRGVLDAWDIIAEETRERWREGADIAIAYADRRVAEAVTEVERICGEWGCNPKFTLLLTSALSPAREGGE